jgi:hypothetical protein
MISDNEALTDKLGEIKEFAEELDILLNGVGNEAACDFSEEDSASSASDWEVSSTDDYETPYGKNLN